MQKHLERCYASSRFVLQVTDPELGDQCFLQHIVSRSALWPKGRQCLILQGCSLQTFLRNSLNKERVRSSILGTPTETCRSRCEPQWKTDFSTETRCVAVQKTLHLWDVWELPNINMLLYFFFICSEFFLKNWKHVALNNIKSHIHQYH